MKKTILILVSLFFLITEAAFPQPGFDQSRKDSLIFELGKAKEGPEKVKLYRQISVTYQYVNPDSAIFYATKGLELSRKMKYPIGEGQLLSELSNINEIHGTLNLAKIYAVNSLNIFMKMEYDAGIAGVSNMLGVLEAKQGNYKIATSHFLRALKINEDKRDTAGIIQSYIKLGLVNDQSGNRKKALEFYERGMVMNKGKINNAYLNLINNMGASYAQMNEMNKALEYFELGLKQSTNSHFLNLHTSFLMNAANASFRLRKVNQARQYQRRAVEQARKYQLKEEEARLLFNMATHSENDDIKLSLSYLDTSLAITQKLNNKQLLGQIYGSYYRINRHLKNYEKAMLALVKHHAYLDSTSSIDKRHEIQALQAEYELNKSNSKIENLQLINQQQLLQRNFFVVAIAAVLIVLTVVIIYLRKRNRLNKELKESNEIKDKLFSIIAHDLRNPIRNVVYVLDEQNRNDFTPKEMNSMLQTIKHQSQITLETMNNLLHWGQTQMKGLITNQVETDIKKIITHNIEEFKIPALRKSIKIKDLSAESIMVNTDPDHISFVFRNLISNAVKFTYNEGEIEINADTLSDPEFVIFSVSDNGQGIKEDISKSLFHHYLNSTVGTDDEKGTGIGLVLCKDFVEANGGKIWLKSNPGKGSVFYFTCRKAK